MILFLDFDGVLHDSEVYAENRRTPVLRSLDPERSLFEYAPLLIEALEEHPDIQIVLSTSWVPCLSFNVSKRHLPKELQRRVIGATYHRHAFRERQTWFYFPRYEQIEFYVLRHQLKHWIALDDDDVCWPAEKRHHLVHCPDPARGLSAPGVLEELKVRLRELSQHSDEKPE